LEPGPHAMDAALFIQEAHACSAPRKIVTMARKPRQPGAQHRYVFASVGSGQFREQGALDGMLPGLRSGGGVQEEDLHDQQQEQGK